MGNDVLKGKSIFPTSYFPPLALAAAIVQHAVKDEIINVEDCETFPKQTLRNRTVILTANGAMSLSVPVLRPQGNHTTTKEIGICYTERWNINHWRAIMSAYNSSPFFLYYRDDVEALLKKQYTRLIDLNDAITDFLSEKLKINISFHHTIDYLTKEKYANDYRDCFSYKHPESLPKPKPYSQVFNDRMPFNPNVSILDLLFNIGPETKDYLLLIDL
ncbi:MAG: WbqC family protein [Bacteroidales bacterium]|nr:WbqC family protein [Bacteroidales bacterium]